LFHGHRSSETKIPGRSTVRIDHVFLPVIDKNSPEARISTSVFGYICLVIYGFICSVLQQKIRTLRSPAKVKSRTKQDRIMASPPRGPPLPSPTLGTHSQHPANYSEWCAAIREVKGLYFNREYKQCASRCDELLEGWKDPVSPFDRHVTPYLFFCRHLFT
jgi:hypothetical protein